MSHRSLAAFIALIYAGLCFMSPSLSADAPSWTGKGMWLLGDTALMAVGVSRDVKSLEEGREIAFQNGKREIEAYFAESPPSKPPVIETPMSYEEVNADGTMNVYLLLKVNLQDPPQNLIPIRKPQVIKKMVRVAQKIIPRKVVKKMAPPAPIPPPLMIIENVRVSLIAVWPWGCTLRSRCEPGNKVHLCPF